MNIHNPLDIIGRRRMTRQLDRKIGEDSTVADAVSALMELPEFKNVQTKIVVCHGNQRTSWQSCCFPRCWHQRWLWSCKGILSTWHRHTDIHSHKPIRSGKVEGGGKGQPDSYGTHRQRLFGHKSLVRELKKRGSPLPRSEWLRAEGL